MKTWIAFGSILKKDVQNYYLKPPNISWGIIFPLSWTLMQMIRSSGGMNLSDIRQMLPGLMAMSVLFGTTSMLAVTITFERKGRSFDRLLLAPIPLSTMVAAKVSGAILFGLFNAFVPVIFAAFFVDLAGINWGAVLLAVFLIAVTSTLLGLMIAVSAKEVFEAQTFSNFFRFPMLFLCGLFLPISSLPIFLRPLSYLLPLTYGTDLLSGSILGVSILSPVLCILVLFAFTAALFVFCQYNIRKKWIL
ncbi:Inner membrane transport permease YadH [Caprobacter fermentans]|uniref:Transport permease protein n=1 Tax=Caproicibacter fermentans TaxID=2576756 RepID=A0A6N8HXG5_9FIRM|nr:ABC transporter permease [Caproicibacter fermentans]MVB10541.1 Inner membrane transport permease YadH [Caproicibacter fermentans]OCN02917.1 ABC transporter [Clostridium sp. W14A]QNK40664.1 ABC transporter permease [Caproicibacter fermentans]